MKAVMSFWSRPFVERFGMEGFRSKEAKIWMLSLLRNRKYFDSIQLVTDEVGLELFTGYGLDQYIDEFVLSFEELNDVDPRFFAAGKMKAYQVAARQNKPFVHLDADVFLFRPPFAQEGRFMAQNRSDYLKRMAKGNWYRPRVIGENLAWKHPEWDDASGRPFQRAVCAGLWGGYDVDLLFWIASSALDMILRPENGAGWIKMHDHFGTLSPSATIEEWWTGVCLAQQKVGGVFVLPDGVRPDRENCLTTEKFLHFWGPKKYDQEWQTRIEELLMEHHQDEYLDWAGRN